MIDAKNQIIDYSGTGNFNNIEITLEKGFLNSLIGIKDFREVSEDRESCFEKSYDNLRISLADIAIILPDKPFQQPHDKFRNSAKPVKLLLWQQYILAVKVGLKQNNELVAEKMLKDPKIKFIVLGEHSELDESSQRDLQLQRDLFVKNAIRNFIISSNVVCLKGLLLIPSLYKTRFSRINAPSFFENEVMLNLLTELSLSVSAIDQLTKIKNFLKKSPGDTNIQEIIKETEINSLNEKTIVLDLLHTAKNNKPDNIKLVFNALETYVKPKKKLSTREATNCEELINLISNSQAIHPFLQKFSNPEKNIKIKAKHLPKAVILQSIQNRIDREQDFKENKILTSVEAYASSYKLSPRRVEHCKQIITLVEKKPTLESTNALLKFFEDKQQFNKGFSSRLQDQVLKAAVLQLIQNTKENHPKQTLVLEAIENYINSKDKLSPERVNDCYGLIALIQGNKENLTQELLNFFRKDKQQFKKGFNSQLQDQVLKAVVLQLIQNTKENHPEQTLVLEAIENYVNSIEKLSLRRAKNCNALIEKIIQFKEPNDLKQELVIFFKDKQQFKTRVVFDRSKLRKEVLTSVETQLLLTTIAKIFQDKNDHTIPAIKCSLLLPLKLYIESEQPLSLKQLNQCKEYLETYNTNWAQLDQLDFYNELSNEKSININSNKIDEAYNPLVAALFKTIIASNKKIESDKEYEVADFKLKFTGTSINIDPSNINKAHKPLVAALLEKLKLQPGQRINKFKEEKTGEKERQQIYEVAGFKLTFTHSIEMEDTEHLNVMPGKSEGTVKRILKQLDAGFNATDCNREKNTIHLDSDMTQEQFSSLVQDTETTEIPESKNRNPSPIFIKEIIKEGNRIAAGSKIYFFADPVKNNVESVINNNEKNYNEAPANPNLRAVK